MRQSLATMCHGVLFVVRAGITPAAVSQKACQELQDANIVGVVLNSAEDSVGSCSYYKYSDYDLGHPLIPRSEPLSIGDGVMPKARIDKIWHELTKKSDSTFAHSMSVECSQL